MVEISTSILTIEKEKATKTFYDLEVAGTDYYHIDIMDGKFVEKNTEELMYEYASTIKQISNLPLDVHLMVEDIKPHIEKYIPLDRLYLSPQCGFASCEIGNKLTEEEQWAKLTLVKEIAKEVWG